MHLLRRSVLKATVLLALALGSSAQLTGPVELVPGDDPTIIAQKLGANWDAGSGILCSTIGGAFFIDGFSGPCAGMSGLIVFDITTGGGVLTSTHFLDLRVSCSSRMRCAVSWDGAPFVELDIGTTTFTGGGDTVTLTGSHTAPALPKWGPLVQGLLVVGAGAFLIGRNLSRRTAHS